MKRKDQDDNPNHPSFTGCKKCSRPSDLPCVCKSKKI